MTNFIFWLCLACLFWTFLGYPLAVLLAAPASRLKVREGPPPAKIALIVAAHNEEEVIGQKIQNCLNLAAGQWDLEIVIVSDGSTDSTNRILENHQGISERLRFIQYQPRRGKAYALNAGLSVAHGEIIVFSDANVILEPNALVHLLRPFADTSVGAVSGHVRIKGKGNAEISGEGLYMRFENLVQKAESRVWSTVGVDGALFAIRRELAPVLAADTVIDDFAISMEAPLHRQRIVFAQDALATEEAIPSVKNEIKRKARIVAGGYQYLFHLGGRLLDLPKGFLFMFFSHKVLRWLAPFFLLGLLISSAALRGPAGYVALTLQIFFYLFATTSLLFPGLRNRTLFYFPFYFSAVNLAALAGAYRFFRGRHSSLWDKVSR